MGPIVAGDTIHARIAGLGICVPDTVLTSAELAGRLGVTLKNGSPRASISTNGILRTGCRLPIWERHSRPGDAMEDAGISPGDVDLIIVATETPDRLVPSTACIIQDRLGLVNAAAFLVERRLFGLCLRPDSRRPVHCQRRLQKTCWSWGGSSFAFCRLVG